jgi:eukaryotic-like serine/threonine-protein kinase
MRGQAAPNVVSLAVASPGTNTEPEPAAGAEDAAARTLDAAVDDAEAGRPALRLGQRAGRFVLLSEVGRGGMGTVFAAYDEHLERKVAIKLLHPGRGAAADASYRERLLREAQAMARVAHPNVVSVYEVGETGGQVFLAMEFVDGVPLSQWQKQQERTWKAVLEMYLQAGRGLAAAHAMGLVHRDFKPDNVLVGRDGRARVLDFGLARVDELQSEAPGLAVPPSAGQTISRALTAAGRVAGTPGYMSPEQYQCEPLDARSDQFSFCVALYEGLYGSLPFGGKSVAEQAANTVAGRLLPPPVATQVPEEVYRILERSLKLDPAE